MNDVECLVILLFFWTLSVLYLKVTGRLQPKEPS
jgi:hypothetical protein